MYVTTILSRLRFVMWSLFGTD